MLHVKVLGPGCPRCFALERAATAALENLRRGQPGLEARLEHVRDPLALQAYNLLFTPALIVNERVVCAGRVPRAAEIEGWLTEALTPA
ncbi:MAG: thioredoxin family protein [Anaerolineales bacterium]|nr:thioredoxin family protein [Anaerolineales bacterium]